MDEEDCIICGEYLSECTCPKCTGCNQAIRESYTHNDFGWKCNKCSQPLGDEDYVLVDAKAVHEACSK